MRSGIRQAFAIWLWLLAGLVALPGQTSRTVFLSTDDGIVEAYELDSGLFLRQTVVGGNDSLSGFEYDPESQSLILPTQSVGYVQVDALTGDIKSTNSSSGLRWRAYIGRNDDNRDLYHVTTFGIYRVRVSGSTDDLVFSPTLIHSSSLLRGLDSVTYDSVSQVLVLGNNAAGNTRAGHLMAFAQLRFTPTGALEPFTTTEYHQFLPPLSVPNSPGGMDVDTGSRTLFYSYYFYDEIFYADLDSMTTVPTPVTPSVITMNAAGVMEDIRDVQFYDGRLYFLGIDSTNDHFMLASATLNDDFEVVDFQKHDELGLGLVNRSADPNGVFYRGFRIVDLPAPCFNKLTLETNKPQARAGETFTATLQLDIDAAGPGLYAFQTELSFDPTVLEILSSAYTAGTGSFFGNANRFEQPITFDNAGGRWFGAVSLQDTPGMPESPRHGTGAFATIEFRVKDPVAAGSTMIVPEDGDTLFITKPNLALPDDDGLSLENTCTEPVTVEILPTSAKVSGRLIKTPLPSCLPGDPDLPLEDYVVTLQGPAGATTLSASDGRFDISGLPAGNYELHAQKSGDHYILPCLSFSLAEGEMRDLGSLALLAGDADSSGKIGDAADLDRLRTDLLTGVETLETDFNEDGVVNVNDFAIFGGHYGEEVCR